MAEIEVPEGVQIGVNGNVVTTKGQLGENARRFNDALISVVKEGSKISIKPTEFKKLRKKGMMAENSFAKEIMNDIYGVQKGYEKNMQSVFAHFPTAVEISGKKILIKNFIGERAPRKVDIVGETKVEVKGQAVRVYGPSKDDVSQTCANIRKTCKIRRKDERTFQDGLYFAVQ
jgi:large subunit ribosomal protein L6